VDVVASEEIDAVESVAGNETLDFVENGKRIEGAEFGLKAVGFKPDGVPIGFAGLRAAGLAEIGGGATRISVLAKGDERADIDAHAAGETDEDFKVGFDAGAVGSLANDLNVAEGVGDGAGFFVEAGGGKDDVSKRCSLGEEKILDD
jgi:hypothetical protein